MTSAAIPDYLEHYETAPFDGDADRLLIEQAHLVAELVKHPGWEILAGRIIAEVERWERRILNGGCADRDEYVKATNYARGLRHLLEAPDALEEAAVAARERVRSRPNTKE